MKKITTLVSALAILGGSLIAHSVKASNRDHDEDSEKSEKASKQKYNGEFEILVVGEIEKGSHRKVFTWPNIAGEEQDFFRIKQRVENEERTGDIKISVVLGKDNSWYLTVGMAGGQMMRKPGELAALGRILIGEDGQWGSAIKSFDVEAFWRGQVINSDTLPTLLKFDCAGITWEQNKVEDKMTTRSSYSGKVINEDPNEIDFNKLKLNAANKTSKKDYASDEKNSNQDRKKINKQNYTSREDSDNDNDTYSNNKKDTKYLKKSPRDTNPPSSDDETNITRRTSSSNKEKK